MSSNIIFRVDSSLKIATGHVMRCIALAKMLRKQQPKVNIIFICRDLEGNIINRISESGFEVKVLPKPDKSINLLSKNQYLEWLEVDLQQDIEETSQILSESKGNIALIIDHYAIDRRWESNLRSQVNKIIAIDDLANRNHDCDILLDQNLYHNYQSRYDALVSEKCQKFLGPQYAILREQFFQIKPRKRTVVKNIMICFGGIDPDNVTLKAVKAVVKAQTDLKINFNVVTVGAKNEYQSEIGNLCEKNNFEYRSYVENMAEVMHWADLSIGAGGSMSWERCYIQLPAIVISLADNQVEICKSLADKNIIKYLGDSKIVSEIDIAFQIKKSYNYFDFKILRVAIGTNEALTAIII